MDLHKAARDPWVWGQFALIAAVAVLAPVLPRFVNLGTMNYALNRVDPVPLRCLGGALALVGLGLSVWGALSLGPSLTPGTEPLPSAPLVTRGAYARVRHPIYGGLVLMLSGYTIAWANWTLGVIIGVLALQYFRGKARAEEVWLMEYYPQYEVYARTVRRQLL